MRAPRVLLRSEARRWSAALQSRSKLAAAVGICACSFGALELDVGRAVAPGVLLVRGVSLGELGSSLKGVGHLPVERNNPRSLTLVAADRLQVLVDQGGRTEECNSHTRCNAAACSHPETVERRYAHMSEQ